MPEFPRADVEAIERGVQGRFFRMCACFWLFRYLHRFESPAAALMGDYCFARFSHHLAKADSIALTAAFSEFLKADLDEKKDMEGFLAFAEGLPGIVDNEN